uniref:hypothetical protein n=1 Tax=Paractinoplanes polyasparticus TaxID=2856853 RepID=UPI0027E08157|nr:hypothetical protein [Actinoplanes polyasparticus]
MGQDEVVAFVLLPELEDDELEELDDDEDDVVDGVVDDDEDESLDDVDGASDFLAASLPADFSALTLPERESFR